MSRRRRRARRSSGAPERSSIVAGALVCLVGVVVLLMLDAVLGIGSSGHEAQVPVVRQPAPGARTVLVVAQDGTVRVLDVGGALEVLLSGVEIVRVEEVPFFVSQSNDRPPPDPHFRYRLAASARAEGAPDAMSAIDLVVSERTPPVGDSLRGLGPDSELAARLDALDPEQVWLVFTVDSASVDVFTEARAMAIDRGFATDWVPTRLAFPITYPITGRAADDFLRVVRPRTKPER